MFKKVLKYLHDRFGEQVAPPPPADKPRQQKKITDKERATQAGEPWVSIVRVEIDPQNINTGAFELDWNDKFVINLIKAGYRFKEDDTDQIIVDRWFQTVCRNIALEVYEQYTADPKNRGLDDIRPITVKKLDDGRSEIS